MSTTENQNNVDTSSTEEAPAKLSIEDLAGMPFAELTQDAIASVVKDKSKVTDLKQAAAYYDVIAGQAEGWIEANRQLQGATRIAGIAYAALRQFVTDRQGEILWSAQSAPAAWRIVYQDRIKSTIKDEDDRNAFDAAVRRYVADRGLIPATMAAYAIANTNNLKDVLMDVGENEKWPLAKVIKIVLGPESAPAIALEGKPWPKQLTDKVESYRQKQRKPGSSNFYRGFEYKATSFGKVVKPEDNGGGGGGGGGHEDNVNNQKAAVDKLLIWPEQDNFNAVQFAKWLRELLEVGAKHGTGAGSFKGRKLTGEQYKALAKQADALGDFLLKVRASENPTKEFVMDLSIPADSK